MISRGISPAGSAPLETGKPFQDTSVSRGLCSREPQMVAASLQSALAKSKAALQTCSFTITSKTIHK